MPMMAVKLRTCSTPWWCNRPRQRRLSRALILATCHARRPMGLMAMARRRPGHGGPAFACKRPSAAMRNRAWARFATRWSAAITSSPSLVGCSAASTAWLVTTWDGSNWPHVSSCSVRVLSHDPKKDAHGRCQHFTNEAMLKMPQIVDTNTSHGEALRQVRTHGFNPLTPASADLQEGGTMGRDHPFTRGCDHEDPMPLGQQGLAEGIDEAFVRWDQACKACHQLIQQLKLMGSGGQQRTASDHPRACEAQAQLQPLVVQVLRGTGSRVSPRLETAVPTTAGVT